MPQDREGPASGRGRRPWRPHRSAGPIDLLVAAAAEEAGLTLLHYDRDLEAIAHAAGQPVRMIDLRD
ncbi:hypothetical protein GCM10027072_55400 [Streptomyces bullii]